MKSLNHVGGDHCIALGWAILEVVPRRYDKSIFVPVDSLWQLANDILVSGYWHGVCLFRGRIQTFIGEFRKHFFELFIRHVRPNARCMLSTLSLKFELLSHHGMMLFINFEAKLVLLPRVIGLPMLTHPVPKPVLLLRW